MFDKILLPLDGSTLSEAIIPYVLQLAKGLGSEVAILHVAAPGDEGYLEHVPDGERIGVPEYLRRMARPFTNEGVSVTTEAVPGHPARQIVQMASERGFDLIAMSTHGRSGSAQWVYGSTTDKVLQAIATSVFLLRPQDEEASAKPITSFKTVIVPLDGSPVGESVLTEARGLARTLDLRIALMRVAPSEETISAFIDPDFFEPSQVTAILSRTKAYLDEKAAILRNEGFIVTTTLAEGYVPDQIIEFAKGTENSLILMSIHGRGGTGRWAIGSVADRVMRASPRPVLTVRPR